MGFCTSWAVCHKGTDRQWLEVVRTDLVIDNLPSALQGLKIAHISDLHYSRTVSSKYIKACFDRVNSIDPDIVLMTGDYVTHDFTGRYSDKISRLLSHIKSRYGIYACLGNHDYGFDGFLNSSREKRLAVMVEMMSQSGITVLRNQNTVLEIDGKALCLVGLGDIWAHDLDLDKAFKNVGSQNAVITLAHNPASVKYMKDHDFDALLCGHTHGLRFQLSPSLRWPIWKENEYHSGMYNLGGRNLYVNRGLGRLGRVSIFSAPRPEITCYTLHG